MTNKTKKINKFIFYGTNSIFKKRMFELTKRTHDSVGVDYSTKSKFDHNIYFAFLESEKLIMQSVYKGFDTIVISSEVLYHIISKEEFNAFNVLINDISKSDKVKLLYVSIINPLKIKYEENKDLLSLKEPLNSNYKTWANKVIESIDKSKNFIYELDSFISYNISNFEENPLNLLKKYPKQKIDESLNFSFSLNSADDFINDILKNLDHIGLLTSKVQTINVEFNEFRNKLNPLLLSSYSQDDNIYNSYNKDKLDKVGQSISKILNQSQCSIQLLYRKKSEEIVNNKPVASWRYNLGKDLCDSVPFDVMEQIDCIVPVPETGKYYAQGLANASKKPYIEAFYKKQDIGRSYDIQNSDKRKKFINNKLGIYKGLLKGKSIGLVDEAIFTGATLKIACNLLSHEEVNKIFIIIPSPTCKTQCSFNMQPIRTLLMEYTREKDLYKYFDVDGVYFQKTSNYEKVMHSANYNCTKCFKL